ncbi:hypothetical protein [Neoroseomonas soli]|uniref:Uncharacterized protein n=1 Tax=Neoroseomonas soli TaxID=1081025 RepID=A0A9X9WWG1_9PROT|nr:hypothetical protein [Neoroseomonas soli]MBR0671490.1 hypothetical protein [Neoroseomonas soli]
MAALPSARRDRIDPTLPRLVEMTRDDAGGHARERPDLLKRDRSLMAIAAPTALGWSSRGRW